MASRSRYANAGEMTNQRTPAVVFHDMALDYLTRAGILLGFRRERNGRLLVEDAINCDRRLHRLLPCARARRGRMEDTDRLVLRDLVFEGDYTP